MSRESLIHEHRPLARWIAREFYWPGAERQDVEQEALIALWAAAEAFDREAGANFKSFATLVIRRRLGTRVKLALGLKHQALNESLRTVVDDETGFEIAAVEMLPGGRDPVEVLIERETVERIVDAAGRLTSMEWEALIHVVNGERYVGSKHIDNAVSRARRKLRAAA